MLLSRVPESEVMDDPAQASAYARADFADVNRGFVDRFLSLFPDFEAGAVLDLGCGPCDIPVRLARAVPGCRIAAVDASRPMLVHAWRAVRSNNLTGRIDLVCARVPSFCVRPGKTFDALISNSLLHHLPDPADFWGSVKRVVRSGAPLLVMDLARPESKDHAREIVRSAAAGEDTILKRDFFRSLLASFTPDEVAVQLESAGLGHLKVRMASDRHWAAAGRIR
ncbi:MAG: class I SAM-dependent methyltransferase [Nitrospirae bacterium]|nr:class I SAM-dependent methyltransferase [Nitrospirota bacterium]